MSGPTPTSIAQGAIDVHYHFSTETYTRELDRMGMAGKEGWGMPEWHLPEALEVMDDIGIATALMAISQPGVYFGDINRARDLARSTNDEGAAIVAEHPQRFGLLASLPLPDVEAACTEAVRALDELSADGVVLMTHYRGTYLGDPSYEPLMEELNRRSALVVLHPMVPVGWEDVSFGIPAPVVEFPIDTTRTVMNLLLSGTLERHPDLKVVVPHTGAGLAVFADRIQLCARLLAGENPVPDVIGQLGRLYYDVAGTPLPRALPALLGLVGPDRLLYGSDLPPTPVPAVKAIATQLAETDVLDDGARELLRRGNAERLVPRLATLAASGGTR